MERSKKHAIALDGPAASGKSTIAKLLAQKLHFVHIDSGAIYRTLTLAIMEINTSSLSEEIVKKETKDIHKLNCHSKIENRNQINTIHNQDVGTRIRSPEVTKNIKYIANNKNCRDWVNTTIREMQYQDNIIVDGRDIASVVLPNIFFKFYVEASKKIRAQRRMIELEKMGYTCNLKNLEKEIKKRDTEDKHRKYGALKKVKEAIYIDTSFENPDHIVKKLIEHLKDIGLKI